MIICEYLSAYRYPYAKFTSRYDAITITVEHEQGGVAKFDVFIDNQLWHNSVRDGVPGPSALDQMYTIVKQILV